MKNLITILFIAVATTSCDISKPLLIESKEAIEAYSGDGIASYLEAPPFGIDGVAIIMSDFNMMNGLD
nr:hypothetical protein [Spirochaetales bacterium]